jgi:hypothetical protein
MPSPTSPPQYGDLPPHVTSDPTVLHWRLRAVELRVEKLEARRQMPSFEKWPWLQIVGVVVLIGMALTGHLSRSDVFSVMKRALGLF